MALTGGASSRATRCAGPRRPRSSTHPSRHPPPPPPPNPRPPPPRDALADQAKDQNQRALSPCRASRRAGLCESSSRNTSIISTASSSKSRPSGAADRPGVGDRQPDAVPPRSPALAKIRCLRLPATQRRDLYLLFAMEAGATRPCRGILGAVLWIGNLGGIRSSSSARSPAPSTFTIDRLSARARRGRPGQTRR